MSVSCFLGRPARYPTLYAVSRPKPALAVSRADISAGLQTADSDWASWHKPGGDGESWVSLTSTETEREKPGRQDECVSDWQWPPTEGNGLQEPAKIEEPTRRNWEFNLLNSLWLFPLLSLPLFSGLHNNNRNIIKKVKWVKCLTKQDYVEVL